MTAAGSARHVLLTGAGRRVALLQAFQHELRARTPVGQVWAADALPARSAACALADGAVDLPPPRDPAYARVLRDVCAARHVGLVVPASDAELPALAAARELLATDGVQVAVSDADLVARAADRQATQALFAARGLQTLALYPHAPPSYPTYALPRYREAGSGRMVRTADELFAARAAEPSLLCTPYLPPTAFESFAVDCYFQRDGMLLSCVPRQDLPGRDGRSDGAVTRDNALVPLLEATLGCLPGARGPLTVQLAVSARGSAIYARGLRARAGAGAVLSYAAGANFAGWLLDEYLFDAALPRSPVPWEPELTMLRHDAHLLRHPPAPPLADVTAAVPRRCPPHPARRPWLPCDDPDCLEVGNVSTNHNRQSAVQRTHRIAQGGHDVHRESGRGQGCSLGFMSK